MTLQKLRLATAFALMLNSAPVWSQEAMTKAVSKIFDGAPQAQAVLSPETYVETTVQKLARPEILYVNWSAFTKLLKELGYDTPPTHLTPEFTKLILNKTGFAKQIDGEPSDAYVTEFKKLYSARYGGHWINDNFGSGRNGAAGLIDIKGIGRTELVRPWAHNDHSSGAMNIGDSLKEAIWSKVLNEELPYGANEVLFILATGTKADPKNPDSEARTLMIRLDAKRPAYFQPNISVTSEKLSDALRAHHVAGDRKRIESVLPKLLDVLPMPLNVSASASEAEILRAAFLEFTDRVCYQYATHFTRQSLMTAISSSNIEFSGAALDFGSNHALLGFPQARADRDESPQGTTNTIKKDLILELAQDLREQLPTQLAAAIPAAAELTVRVDTQFAHRVSQGFLELAGTPKEFSEKMLLNESGQRLAQQIEHLARKGNNKIEEFKDGTIVARTGTYNLERILNRLVAMQVESSSLKTSMTVDDVELAAALPSATLRADLVETYASYVGDVMMAAAHESIAPAALLKYMKLAVKVRNRPYYGLREKWSFWPKASKAIRQYFAGDEFAVQDFLDLTYERNVRDITSRPFTLEVSDTSKLRNGLARHELFDLKTGQTIVSEEKLLSRVTREARNQKTKTIETSVRNHASAMSCKDI